LLFLNAIALRRITHNVLPPAGRHVHGNKDLPKIPGRAQGRPERASLDFY
jgi:hypothetical protein